MALLSGASVQRAFYSFWGWLLAAPNEIPVLRDVVKFKRKVQRA
jgi:hypothetical protein